jgi:hypothetical protein
VPASHQAGADNHGGYSRGARHRCG